VQDSEEKIVFPNLTVWRKKRGKKSFCTSGGKGQILSEGNGGNVSGKLSKVLRTSFFFFIGLQRGSFKLKKHLSFPCQGEELPFFLGGARGVPRGGKT